MDDSSVRARLVNGPPGLTVSHLHVGLSLPDNDGQRPPAKDEELEEARQAVRRLEDRIEQGRGMIARLEKLDTPDRPPGARGEKPPPPPTVARLAMVDFCRDQLDRLGEENQRLAEELRRARDELRLLEDRWRRSTTDRQARVEELRKTIVLHLARDNPQDPLAGRLEIDYLVPGARWAPGYTLRFDPDFARADLELRALVCQATGENWEGVRLTLSTAASQRWTDLPELPALRIGRAQPPPARSGWRPPPTGADSLFADYDRAVQRLEPPPTTGAEAPYDLPAELEDEAMPVAGAAVAVAEEEILEDLLLEPEAAPPPEMAMAAPVAASIGPNKAAKRSRGIPSPPLSAGTPPPPEEVSELVADSTFLNYGCLRLPAADHPNRGTLLPAPSEEIYRELLIGVRVEMSVEVMVAVREAVSRAADVAREELPPGYIAPSPWMDFDFAYRAADPVTVAADGLFHSLPLLSTRADTALRHVVVPRETTEVFRFVTLTNPLATPLPEGPADIFVGSDFLLSSPLRTVPPEAGADLGLGAEEAIKAARNTTFLEESSGLLGGKLRLVHGITVDLDNHLGAPATVEVRERLPVVREGDQEVEVEVAEVDPPWERFAQKNSPIEGGYRWRVELEAGERRSLSATYAVTVDSKNELIGGNRREE
jgi:hypothetical protein